MRPTSLPIIALMSAFVCASAAAYEPECNSASHWEHCKGRAQCGYANDPPEKDWPCDHYGITRNAISINYRCRFVQINNYPHVCGVVDRYDCLDRKTIEWNGQPDGCFLGNFGCHRYVDDPGSQQFPPYNTLKACQEDVGFWSNGNPEVENHCISEDWSVQHMTGRQTCCSLCVLSANVWNNGLDDDGDGISDEACETTTAPSCGCVPSPEVCNHKDDDCDGEIDEGFEFEICDNGLDDNCDGVVDENCPEHPEPPDDRVCSPSLIHDPVNITNGQSYIRNSDLVIAAPADLVELSRTYYPRGNKPSPIFISGGQLPVAPAEPRYPTPFGRIRPTIDSIKWSHNFFSYVREQVQGSEVFAPNGKSYQYDECTPGATESSCWASLVPGQDSVRHRLKMTDAVDGREYLFVMDDGRSYRYSHRYQGGVSQQYFLKEVRSPQNELMATLDYAAQGLDVECAYRDVPNVPYLSQVAIAGGTTLTFTYKGLRREAYHSLECVLDEVKVNGSVAVSYAYKGNLPGDIESVRRSPEGELIASYNHASDEFGFFYSGQSGSHAVDPLTGKVNGITAESGLNQVSILYDANTSSNTTQFEIPKPYGSSSATVTRSYVIGEAENWLEDRVESITESCVDGVCMPGTTTYLDDKIGYVSFEKGANVPSEDSPSGAFHVSQFVASSSSFPALVERTQDFKGAIAESGAGALETVRYTYSYDSLGRQRVDAKMRISVLDSGVDTTVKYRYDEDNRPIAAVRYGKTKELQDNEAVDRYIGVFVGYPGSANQIGPCADSNPNDLPYEVVQGPCLVNSESASSCSGVFPLETRLYAEPAANSQFSRGYLLKVIRYPNGCESTGVSKTFSNHDAFGNVGTIVDENGVVTTFIYSAADAPEHRPTSKTVAGKTWTYGYDNGKLSWLRKPEGNYEVFCHRLGSAGAACDMNATWSSNLQWRAKAADQAGLQFSEKIAYSYRTDGTVDRATYIDFDGTVRKIKRFAADASGNIIREGLGEPDANGRAPIEVVRAFNQAGVSRLGLPFVNDADDMPDCDDDANYQCTRLKYDRAERLSSVASYASSSSDSASKTLFSYDGHGNIVGIKSGCADGDSYQSCTVAALVYEYDDFGNLIRARLPYLGTPTQPGYVGYEYDASGNVVKKDVDSLRNQTAAAWWEFQYDQLGRLLSASRASDGVASEILYSLEYDNSGAEVCDGGVAGAVSGTMGRLRQVTDSFGRRWFSYDQEGRVIKEIRQRPVSGAFVCSSGTVNQYPSMSYEYSDNGNFERIVYPHGRVIEYRYGTTLGRQDRVSEVWTAIFSGPADSVPTQVLRKVSWEPYGDVREYELVGAGVAGSVEYLAGDVASEPADSCAISRPTGNTKTGLLKSLWVSRVGLDDDDDGENDGVGDLLKRTYAWKGDQASLIDSCVLNTSGLPRREDYSASGYDQMLRLRSVTSPLGRMTLSERAYSLDSRGRRINESVDGTLFSNAWDPVFNDRIASRKPVGNEYNGHYYEHDSDGRVTEMSHETAANFAMEFSYSVDAARAGRDLVFQAAKGFGGTWYNYYYDAFGRRQSKAYPLNGKMDEFFYDLGHQILTDQGNSTTSVGGDFITDDYIWLAGRPVAMVKGKLDSAWTRLADTGLCTRNGEAASCGVYFIVTDHLPKPVMMLDSALKVVGAADYDPFGHVNRQFLNSESAHPYLGGITEVLGTCDPKVGPAEAVKVRVSFHLIDLNKLYRIPDRLKPNSYASDYVRLKNSSGSNLQSCIPITRGGYRSSVVTPLADGLVNVVLDSPSVYGGGASGVVVDSCEYQRYEVGVTYPVWTPIRFPGQYHDAETDLFENWNRYYDPSIGRYLQPEPILENPRAGVSMMKRGVQMNAYAYAASNPLKYVDRNGLWIVIPEAPSSRLSSAINELLQSSWGRALWNDLDASDTRYVLRESAISWFQGHPVGGTCGGAGHERKRNGLSEVDILIDFAGIDDHNKIKKAFDAAGFEPTLASWTDLGVLAHEMGHGLDFTHGLPGRLGPAGDWSNDKFADFVMDKVELDLP